MPSPFLYLYLVETVSGSCDDKIFKINIYLKIDRKPIDTRLSPLIFDTAHNVRYPSALVS